MEAHSHPGLLERYGNRPGLTLESEGTETQCVRMWWAPVCTGGTSGETHRTDSDTVQPCSCPKVTCPVTKTCKAVPSELGRRWWWLLMDGMRTQGTERPVAFHLLRSLGEDKGKASAVTDSLLLLHPRFDPGYG